MDIQQEIPIQKKRFPGPAVVLFFLAPAIGELLSSSSPPAEFFNLFNIVLLGLLYGGGAILIRELVFRYKKGWVSMLLFGAAYGIIEEGWMVKSFFDPGWVDIGMLGSYGRAWGVNWVWTVELIIFHTVFSICIPILLVNLLFPGQRQQAWVSRKSFVVLSILFFADVIFGFLALTPYRPDLIPYVVFVLLAAALIFAGFKINPTTAQTSNPLQPARRARSYYYLGLAATITYFFSAWILPNLLPPVAVNGLMILVAGVTIVMVKRMSKNWTAWNDQHQLALASGALSFLILITPITEMDPNRPDNTTGMILVGLISTVFLVWLAYRIRRKDKTIKV